MIGIFGDSFSDDRGDIKGWPRLLSEHIGENIINYSVAGSSIWYSFKNFLKNYSSYQKIIFTYSSYTRWQTLNEPYEWMSAVKETKDIIFMEQFKNEAKTLVEAHKLLYDEEFNLYTYRKIFDDVNKICAENNIHLVNVLPFESKNSIFPLPFPLYGSCLIGLNIVSSRELARNIRLQKHLQTNNDTRICHMSNYNNQVTVKQICKLWQEIKVIDASDINEYRYDIF